MLPENSSLYGVLHEKQLVIIEFDERKTKTENKNTKIREKKVEESPGSIKDSMRSFADSEETVTDKCVTDNVKLRQKATLKGNSKI